MLSSALRAVEQMFSPPFRVVFFKALGLTIALFVAVGVGLQALLAAFTISTWPYVDATLAVLAGLGVIVGLVFLIGPITALFAGLFLDEVAEAVEREHYPDDRPGRELPVHRALLVAAKFTLILIAVNVLILMVAWMPGINIAAFLAGNGYLLGREYFEMVAMRHMGEDEARALRSEYSSRVFMAGLLIAGLAMIPFANLFTPLFATAFMVHVFKRVQERRGGRLIEAH